MSAEAQIKKKSTRINLNPFQQVLVHDSVRHTLATFLWSTQNDSSGIMINHVLGKDKDSQYRFVEGIYRFRANSVHAISYHFIYTKNDGVQILKDYAIENTLEAVIRFFKMSKPALSSQEKLNYLSTLLADLKQREKMMTPGFHGDYEIREKSK